MESTSYLSDNGDRQASQVKMFSPVVIQTGADR